MRRRLEQVFEIRIWRHTIFWLSWVLGFTFIKSFGQSVEFYLAWFIYYLATLPIFLSHAYLIAYVLIPHFFNRRGMILFVLSFSILFYGFSVLELILSNELIFRRFPGRIYVANNYLATGNVMLSGLGNLYIILVFLATRTIRNWIRADNRQKMLKQQDLKQQMEDTMIRVQPLMLLYAIDHIDRMVDRSDPEVTNAIALTSELLSEVMMYHEEEQRWFSREIELVKKLLDLVALFKGTKPEVEFFISGDPGTIELPPMILFSFVDLVIRWCERDGELPELNIEASGFSNMISIQVLKNELKSKDDDFSECVNAIRKLKSSYAGRVDITYEQHGYGCSVVIRGLDPEQVNAIHGDTGDVDPSVPADP